MTKITNSLKSTLLLTVLTLMLIYFGRAVGGPSGMTIAFILAIVMNGVSYWFSDKIAIKMTRSRPLTRSEAPWLYEMVEKLTRRANLPMPKLYLTPSHQPNAFATGRNPAHAAVAVTEGIMQLLSREELEGVIAHELAHIKNRDVFIGTLAAVMAGVITMVADMARWAMLFGGLRGDDDEEGGVSGLAALPLLILAPIAALLVQMAISRSREYLADATGAEIAGRPHGLANALLRLEQGAKMIPMQASPATSHLFIVNPFAGSSLLALFSTHPPVKERVARLMAR